MAHNLKKFETEAEYQAAELNYPSVAWVTSGDTLHYDKAEPQPETEKVALTFASSEQSGTIKLYNGDAADANLITGLTFNGEPIDPIVPEIFNVPLESVNVIEYDIDGAAIFDAFAGDLTDVGASSLPSIEFLIPSFITDVDYLPDNEITNIVIMATTPPEVAVDFSSLNAQNLYVPDAAVSAYQNSAWSGGGVLTILPLSEYEGNLPV